ncbi:MAG: hypothetical protein FWG68_10445 [Defluviitaleaceae bacterium]|nr:hypothetical protein [Defluviitaleaceae bacterium]
MQTVNDHKIDNHHHYDKVFKESLMLFIGKTLAFFDPRLQGWITQILSTEVTEISAKKAFADLAFLLSTGKGIHFEMELDLSLDDILRFAAYNIELTRMHKVPFLTVILTLEKPTITKYETDCHKFEPIIICLKDRDADATLQNLQAELKNGELANELELIYLPLYNSKSGKTKLDLAISAVNLTSKISQKNLQNKLQGMLLMQVVEYLTKEEMKKLLEECAMVLKGKPALEAFKELYGDTGREEGKIEEAAEIIIKMLKKGFKVAQISDILEKPIELVQELQNQLPEPK